MGNGHASGTKSLKLAPTQSRSLGEMSTYWDSCSRAMATTRPCLGRHPLAPALPHHPITCSIPYVDCNVGAIPLETIDPAKLRGLSPEPSTRAVLVDGLDSGILFFLQIRSPLLRHDFTTGTPQSYFGYSDYDATKCRGARIIAFPSPMVD